MAFAKIASSEHLAGIFHSSQHWTKLDIGELHSQQLPNTSLLQLLKFSEYEYKCCTWKNFQVFEFDIYLNLQTFWKMIGWDSIVILSDLSSIPRSMHKYSMVKWNTGPFTIGPVSHVEFISRVSLPPTSMDFPKASHCRVCHEIVSLYFLWWSVFEACSQISTYIVVDSWWIKPYCLSHYYYLV